MNALIYETGSKLALPFARIKKKERERWKRTSRTPSIALISYAQISTRISIMRVELIGYPLDAGERGAYIDF